MPQPDQYDPSSLTPRRMICERCGKPLRPIRFEPDPRYSNLDILTSVCDCGEDAGRFVARPSLSRGSRIEAVDLFGHLLPPSGQL
jgi:hypothetical protein